MNKRYNKEYRQYLQAIKDNIPPASLASFYRELQKGDKKKKKMNGFRLAFLKKRNAVQVAYDCFIPF